MFTKVNSSIAWLSSAEEGRDKAKQASKIMKILRCVYISRYPV